MYIASIIQHVYVHVKSSLLLHTDLLTLFQDFVPYIYTNAKVYCPYKL